MSKRKSNATPTAASPTQNLRDLIGTRLKRGAWVGIYELKRRLEAHTGRPLRVEYLLATLLNMDGYIIDCGESLVFRDKE